MCTVTIVPIWEGSEPSLRIACNRDESRGRSIAMPPRLLHFGSRSALLPIDPVSGGTWIAVNNAGLVMVLLNRNPSRFASSPAGGSLSRGMIIPSLLGCDTLTQATQMACELSPEAFAPFRLVLANRTEGVEASNASGRMRCVERSLVDGPVMFTSSGLGDDLVEGPRRQLFRDSFQAREGWLDEQDSFHRHSWPNAPHLSVCMRREDACTVNFTVVELRSHSARMTYRAQPPDKKTSAVSLSLSLQSMEAV